MKIITLFVCCLCMPPALADVTPISYHVGSVSVDEDGKKILLHASPLITVSILPGGKTWPALSLDEGGRIYAGNVIVDPLTGLAVAHLEATLMLPDGVGIAGGKDGFEFQHAGKKCVLSLQQLGLDRQRHPVLAMQNLNIVYSSSKKGILALVTQFGKDGKFANYLTEKINIEHCRVEFQHNLGNPDLLVELGYSTLGGWWITGSVEQTLLQSSDGRQWYKVALPADLSGLISAYITNPREIWLAAILPPFEASPYLLVYSSNGGRTWRNVVANDPLLRKIPAGWLEGQKRRVLH